jgi:lipopolysaccharide export system protein LptA
MRWSWIHPFGVAVLLTALPATAESQTRSCRQELPADARRIVNARGQEVVYFLDPVRVLCTGGVRLEADSAVMNNASASVILVGNVVFQDSVQRLEADWANYLGRADQLLARGGVAVTNLDDGAVVTGEDLNYLRETEARPEARAVVTGGRPHAVLPPPRDSLSGPATDTTSPTEVWARRLELYGGTGFEAIDDVELARGDVVGAADTARFDPATQRMTLLGTAHVESPQYRLEGQRIDAYLEAEELREVVSEGRARVLADELDVRSERVRIEFVDGEVERLEAWNEDPETAPRRARATAESFRLQADSIDARADSLGIREVRAVGRAYGERDVDSLAVGPAAVVRDWIQGDTITGFFARTVGADERGLDASAAPPVEPGEGTRDSVRTVLERIEVAGGEGAALSLYRMAPDDPEQRDSINFMKAKRIILFMEEGDVARVEAVGPIDGIYLDPVAPTTAPDSATAAPDSAAAPGQEAGS